MFYSLTDITAAADLSISRLLSDDPCIQSFLCILFMKCKKASDDCKVPWDIDWPLDTIDAITLWHFQRALCTISYKNQFSQACFLSIGLIQCLIVYWDATEGYMTSLRQFICMCYQSILSPKRTQQHSSPTTSPTQSSHDVVRRAWNAVVTARTLQGNEVVDEN